MNDVTGLAVALTATARTRAQQLARDLQAAQRRLLAAGTTLTTARQAYARAGVDRRRARGSRRSAPASPASGPPEDREVSSNRAAQRPSAETESAHCPLWITVWQARYMDGDAGLLPSPLRREVPERIHPASLPKPPVPRSGWRPLALPHRFVRSAGVDGRD